MSCACGPHIQHTLNKRLKSADPHLGPAVGTLPLWAAYEKSKAAKCSGVLNKKEKNIIANNVKALCNHALEVAKGLNRNAGSINSALIVAGLKLRAEDTPGGQRRRTRTADVLSAMGLTAEVNSVPTDTDLDYVRAIRATNWPNLAF